MVERCTHSVSRPVAGALSVKHITSYTAEIRHEKLVFYRGIGDRRLLVACSNVPYAKRNSDRLAAYTAAAGAPVKSFHFFSPLYSWEPLSDTQLVVYTKYKEAYLLDLDACANLQVTNGIGLTSNLGQVQVRFDKVITRSPRHSLHHLADTADRHRTPEGRAAGAAEDRG